MGGGGRKAAKDREETSSRLMRLENLFVCLLDRREECLPAHITFKLYFVFNLDEPG